MAASTIKLKLLVDTKAKKVILAEAGKDFIDFSFTFSLCLLPLLEVCGALEEIDVNFGMQEAQSTALGLLIERLSEFT
ncbi:hypothetical protein JRO89_XS14G0056400 [Xanthoceras sorbifolium]|uniref:Uncharacterized protein n=1 Tax=Xanthoceras sorbifolium TaxID=99658 RepID=A0ABQ8H3W7_9ROSI|nr:hypothetical protein JRO89_XS14G0056400 [Xanthoceras sorbifolium]